VFNGYWVLQAILLLRNGLANYRKKISKKLLQKKCNKKCTLKGSKEISHKQVKENSHKAFSLHKRSGRKNCPPPKKKKNFNDPSLTLPPPINSNLPEKMFTHLTKI